MDNLSLAITLKAFDEMSRVVESAVNKAAMNYAELQEKVSKVSDKMQRIGAAAVAGGIAIGAATLKPINAFADLEDAVTRAKVAFMTNDGVDKGFVEVQKVAESLGTKLPGTTSDFTVMASKLKELGLATTTIAKGGLEATGYLRVLMGNLAPEQAAELTATFKTSLGIAEQDFVKFIDLVQRQKFAFGVDPSEFAYTLKYIGPLAKQLGLVGYGGAQSVVALSGALSQAGIKGEQLGTSLRGVFQALPDLNSKIAKSKELGPILQKSGIALEFFRGGRFLGVENLVGQLDKLKKLNPQERLIVLKELFGAEASTAMAEVVSQGVTGYNKALTNLSKQASLQARLNLVMGTFRNLWEAASGTFETTLATFGSSIAGDLKRGAELFNQISEKVGNWAKEHPKLTRAIALGTLGLSGFLIVGGTTLLMVGTLGKGLAHAIGAFGKIAGGARGALPYLDRFRDAINYRGGAIPALQHQLLLARYRLLELNGNLKTWIATQASALKTNFWPTLNTQMTLAKMRLFDAAGALKSWTLAQASAFRASFLTISGLRAMGTSLVTNVRTAFLTATSASWAFTASLLASPITWIAIGIAGAGLLIWKYWKPITGFFRGLWAGIKEGAAPIAQALAPAFKALAGFLSPVIGLLKGVWNWVSNLVKPVDDTGKAAENLGLRWGRTIGGMLVAVASLPAKLFNAGRTMVEMLWKGIMALASKPAEAMKSIVQKVRNLLPFSPAKEGPLRDLHRIRLVETIAEGVRPSPLVTAMTQTVKLARMAVVPQIAAVPAAIGASIARPAPLSVRAAQAGNAASGGGQTVIHYAPSITIPGGTPDIEEKFAALLRQHKNELLRLVESAKSTKQRSAYA